MNEIEFEQTLLGLKKRAMQAGNASHALGERAKDQLFSYDEAIGKGDLAQVKVILAGLKETLKEAEADLDALDALAADVATLTKEGATFSAHYEEVKQLTADVSETRRKAATRPVPLKAGIHAVEGAIAKLADGNTELGDAWAKIDALVRARDSAVDDERSRLDKIKPRALAAAAGHLAGDLKKAQDEAGNIGAMFENVFNEALKTAMADFTKRLAHNPSFAQRPEFVRQKAETQKKIAAILERSKANGKLRDEIRAVKLAQIDLAKAAKELGGIASSLMPKLDKALAQDPTGMLKAIEAVLKEAGRNMTGKDAVAKLKKAKVI